MNAEADAAQKRHEGQLQEWRKMKAHRDAWWAKQAEGDQQRQATGDTRFPSVGTAVVHEADLKQQAEMLGEPECYLE